MKDLKYIILFLFFSFNVSFAKENIEVNIINGDNIDEQTIYAILDTYNEIRNRGYDAPHAAFRAGLLRFRPVVLTAITTILGLLPMVFALTIKFLEREILVGAPSSQWWTQLASTIAGGLTFATILTLLATPALIVFGNGTSEFLKSLMNRINYRSRKTSLN